jgi:hypothetical protein
MLNMLLLFVVSVFQLQPIDGSPTASAIPRGAAKFMNRGTPGVAATACGDWGEPLEDGATGLPAVASSAMPLLINNAANSGRRTEPRFRDDLV